jgi:hypothetical protein
VVASNSEADQGGSVYRALCHLRQAEAELVEAIREGGHLRHARFVEAHAFLREALAKLSAALGATEGN